MAGDATADMLSAKNDGGWLKKMVSLMKLAGDNSNAECIDARTKLEISLGSLPQLHRLDVSSPSCTELLRDVILPTSLAKQNHTFSRVWLRKLETRT